MEACDLAGDRVGALAVWPREQRRRREAVRVDRRVIDPRGPAMAVSLVLTPRLKRVIFDDPAVVRAVQRVLERPPAAFVSTLSCDPVHFAGAVPGIEQPWPGSWDNDPFTSIFPARRLRVAGMFGRTPPPAGPVHQRYGGAPWPADRFE